MKNAYKPIAVFVLICLAFTVFAMLFLRVGKPPGLRLGERMTYGIYVGGTRVGSWEMGIEENMTTWENVRCYKASYSMALGRVQQGGWMEFDENGGLRHARVWYYLDNVPRWATEIAYFPTLKVMYVVENNYENNSCENAWVPMQRETTIAEHLWYLLRTEPLKLGYSREFDLSAFPRATQLVPARVDVLREEKVETFAGTFDCWLISGQGPFNRMWVEKGGRLVAMVQEQSRGQTRVFLLESYA